MSHKYGFERNSSQPNFLGKLKFLSWDSPPLHGRSNLMQFLFSYLLVSQIITSSLLQSISATSTKSVSFRPSVSSQSNNISVGVLPTPRRDLSLTTRASAILELSSQGGFLTLSFFTLQTDCFLVIKWVNKFSYIGHWIRIWKASQEVNQRIKPLLVL